MVMVVVVMKREAANILGATISGDREIVKGFADLILDAATARVVSIPL